MSAALLALSSVAGLAIVGVPAADAVGTLVVTGTAGTSPARLYYRYTWAGWRGLGRRVKDERQRERWLAVYGPMAMLSLLLIWLVALAEIGRRLQVGQGTDLLNRDLFAIAYARLGEAGLPLDDFVHGVATAGGDAYDVRSHTAGADGLPACPGGLLGPFSRARVVTRV